MQKHEKEIIKLVRLILSENMKTREVNIEINISKKNFIVIYKFYIIKLKNKQLSSELFSLDESVFDTKKQFNKMKRFILASKAKSLSRKY